MVSDNEPIGLHNRLALFRVDRGLSRVELADLVAVNPQTIGFLERSHYGPSLELGLRLAAVFGVPVEMLFSLTPFAALASQLGVATARSYEGGDDG